MARVWAVSRATVRLAGTFDLDVTVPAEVVGSIAVHRPTYQYMRGTPVTYGRKGWAVTHVPSGMSLTRWAPTATRAQALQWARAVQDADPGAWDDAAGIPFGGGFTDHDLARRLIDAIHATA